MKGLLTEGQSVKPLTLWFNTTGRISGSVMSDWITMEYASSLEISSTISCTESLSRMDLARGECSSEEPVGEVNSPLVRQKLFLYWIQ